MFCFNGIFGPGGFLSTSTTSDLNCDTRLSESDYDDIKTQGEENMSDIFVQSPPLKLKASIVAGNPGDYAETGTGPGPGPGYGVLPHEFALSMDHILEKIFCPLTIPELFKCRLVCHQWNSIANAKLLQKQFQLNFTDIERAQVFMKLIQQHPTAEGDAILNPNSRHAYPAPSPLALPFPCTKFSFGNLVGSHPTSQSFLRFLRHPAVREIFKIYGVHIEELTIKFYDLTSTSRAPADDTDPEEVNDPEKDYFDILEEIWKIIVYDCPNVTRLNLKIGSHYWWNDWGLRRGPLLPVPGQACAPPLSQQQRQVNMNLKLLDISQLKLPPHVMQMILQLAPNLEEIISHKDYQHYLLEPINLLHLLKKLVFEGNHMFGYSASHKDTYERIAEASEGGRVRLREIIACIEDPNSNPNPTARRGRPDDSRARAINIITTLNKILEANRDSLEFIDWRGSTFPPEFHFPRVMPNVRKACLRFSHSPEYKFDMETVTPAKFSWATIFPNLQRLTLCNLEERVLLLDFIRILKLTLMKTVKKLFIHCRWEIMTEEHLNLLGALFPSAQVFLVDNYRKYDHRDDDYDCDCNHA